MNASEIADLNWSKENGLLPAIAQHALSGRVLMLGYVNREALAQCFERGLAVFFSRTRQKLWTKGETSGNYLHVESIATDCDRDSLLLLVRPTGPTCHQGSESCFDNGRPFFDELDRLIADRIKQSPDDSYTAQLASAGVATCARKVGEEALEVVLAGIRESDERLASEAADLLYHLLVLTNRRSLSLNDIAGVLSDRARAADT